MLKNIPSTLIRKNCHSDLCHGAIIRKNCHSGLCHSTLWMRQRKWRVSTFVTILMTKFWLISSASRLSISPTIIFFLSLSLIFSLSLSHFLSFSLSFSLFLFIYFFLFLSLPFFLSFSLFSSHLFCFFFPISTYICINLSASLHSTTYLNVLLLINIDLRPPTSFLCLYLSIFLFNCSLSVCTYVYVCLCVVTPLSLCLPACLCVWNIFKYLSFFPFSVHSN